MIQRRKHLGFVLKSSHAIGIAHQRRGQDFERNVALEGRIASAVDLAHSALTEQGEDLVVTEFIGDRQRHEYEQVYRGASEDGDSWMTAYPDTTFLNSRFGRLLPDVRPLRAEL